MKKRLKGIGLALLSVVTMGTVLALRIRRRRAVAEH